jgi:hypothetical protein
MFLIRIGAVLFLYNTTISYVDKYPNWRDGEGPVVSNFRLAGVQTTIPRGCLVQLAYEDPVELTKTWHISALFQAWDTMYRAHSVEQRFRECLFLQIWLSDVHLVVTSD